MLGFCQIKCINYILKIGDWMYSRTQLWSRLRNPQKSDGWKEQTYVEHCVWHFFCSFSSAAAIKPSVSHRGVHRPLLHSLQAVQHSAESGLFSPGGRWPKMHTKTKTHLICGSHIIHHIIIVHFFFFFALLCEKHVIFSELAIFAAVSGSRENAA